MVKYDGKKVMLIVVILLCSAIFLLFDKFPSQASLGKESNRYFTFQSSNENLTIISPRNYSYGKAKIPIVIENTSFVNACWYRYNNGSGWSNNFTLESNGMVFQDLYTIWSEGKYHLQVFASESGNEIYSEQWFEVSFSHLGTYWCDSEEGLEPNWYSALTQSLNGSIYVGRYHAGEIYISNNNGESWKNISNGLIGVNRIYSIIETSNGTLFAGTVPNGDIFKSTNGGKSWQNSSNGIIGATRIYSQVELENGSILVGAYPNGDFFISHDQGLTWKNTSTGLGSFSMPWNILEVKNGSIYSVTNNGLYISNDGGASWKDISGGLIDIANLRSITQISNGSLYIPVTNSTGSFIQISNDGGSNWRIVPTPVKPGNDGTGLLETRNGTMFLSAVDIFRSDDSGASWFNVSNGIEGVERTPKILEISDGSIVGLTDHGVFRLPLFNSTRGDGIDVAIFLAFANITYYWISNDTQNGIQEYLKNNLDGFQSITSYRYYQQDLLSNWVNDHLNDSVPDVILFLDRVPANLFAGEDDGSKLEEFFEDGNTIMFSGKSPCANSVDELGNNSYFGPSQGLTRVSDGDLHVTSQDYTFYKKNDIYGNPIPSLESTYISRRPLNDYSSRTSVTAFSSYSEGYHDCVFANVIGSGQYFSIYMIDNDTLNRNSTIEEFLENYYLPYYNLTYDGNLTQFTFDPKSEYGLSDPVVFGSENKVFYIWHSSRGDSVDLWYKTSLNGGKSWSAPVRLDIAATENRDSSPSICLDAQDNIYIAWESNYGGDYNIWFTNTSDWGKSWEPTKKITNNINNDMNARLKIDSLGNLYLIFLSQRSPQGLYIVNSTNKGAIWSEPKLIYGYDYSDDKIHDFIIDNSDIFYI
ncbi:MAG: exo-alpha-sialidase, partial [Promethearchaeota archaeon]